MPTEPRELLPEIEIRDTLEGPRETIKLKKTITLRVERVVGIGIVADHPELPFVGSGDTGEDAAEDFRRMFSLVWAIMNRPGVRIAGAGKVVRSVMREYVDENGRG